MRTFCRHGAPVTIEITPADWQPDYPIRYTVKMTTCKACDEEGITAAILGIVEGVLRRAREPL